MEDRKFLAEAERAKLEVQPLSGDEVQELIKTIFSSNPAVLQRTRDVLK
jgi:hypothetical protein